MRLGDGRGLGEREPRGAGGAHEDTRERARGPWESVHPAHKKAICASRFLLPSTTISVSLVSVLSFRDDFILFPVLHDHAETQSCPFAKDLRPSGRTVYLPVPFRLKPTIRRRLWKIIG